MRREHFVRKLENSGLLSTAYPVDLSPRPSDPQPTAHSLAMDLVRECQLTEYQARILLEEESGLLSFGNYRILQKIGQGGMGVVYKARHDSYSDLVALKVLSNSLTKNREAIRRFAREAELATRLVHINIVQAIECGVVDGKHFLSMEYVDGSDVARICKERAGLPLLTAFEYLRDATRGLHYAHQQHVIHRDIKPSNLLVHRNGTLKILDMGLARSLADGPNGELEPTELTMTGTLLGTAAYMAPEQALNSKNADFRADIYSLGCTFYYLLFGKDIYDGTTMMEKIIAHREQPIPKLSELRDDIPKTVERLFEQMVAKDSQHRYQATGELLKDIEACFDEFGHMWMIKRYLREQKGRMGRADLTLDESG